ncbi:AI-2E family transporter [Flaviflexus equikiangi]|uniref:AI-2E family transporter n=1 Tax=Flaviflexus equikiangi TaxID=2758573 RepID=UPI0015F5AEDD|nr:AI-2E family transporter [Flaviflexus equikiangi]
MPLSMDDERRTIKQRALDRRKRLAQGPVQRTDSAYQARQREREQSGEHTDSAVPWALRTAASWSWRILLIGIAAFFIMRFMTFFSTILLAILIAMLLTVLTEPILRFFRSKVRMPRTLAAAVTLVSFLLLVGGLVGGAGASIFSGFSDLSVKAADGFDQLLEWLSDSPLGIGTDQLEVYLNELQGQLSSNAGSIAGGVLSATGSLVSFFTGLILALFTMFFFLKDGRKMWFFIVRMFPAAARDDVNEAGIRAWYTLGAYTRTQIQVAAIDAVGIAGVAAVLGVSLWFPIGVLVFVGSFVPIVGAFVTGAIATLVALVDQGVADAIFMLIGVLAVQQIEGNVLQPYLQGNKLSLHPVVVVVAVAAGSIVAGIFGALFAVPLVAAVNVVVNYLVGRDMYPELNFDPNRPGGPPEALDEYVRSSDEKFAIRAERAQANSRSKDPGIDESENDAQDHA